MPTTLITALPDIQTFLLTCDKEVASTFLLLTQWFERVGNWKVRYVLKSEQS